MSQRADTLIKALAGFAAGIIVATVGVLEFVDGRIDRASARAATDAVTPIRSDLQHHLTDMEKLRPEMGRAVDRLNGKLDLLLEDCYRRGGCKQR